jgi:hypothetical protein
MGPGPRINGACPHLFFSFEEEPCPLSLSHGFFTIQPSPSKAARLFPKTFSNYGNGDDYLSKTPKLTNQGMFSINPFLL